MSTARTNSSFYKEIEDADIIINGYVYFGKKELDTMKHCKVLSFQSTGYNEVDLEYATERGIAVCSILDYCTQETAENAMALMLNLQRGIRRYDKSVQQDKVWDYLVAKDMHLRRIAGQTMGIAGLGRIGQSVARKAMSFDMPVIAYDPYLPPEIAEKLGVKLVDFDTLLEQSDVISIHMNLTDENFHIFNKDAFKKMKKQPIIINEGRGALICDDDLLWALIRGLSAVQAWICWNLKIRISASASCWEETTSFSLPTADIIPKPLIILWQNTPWTMLSITTTASWTKSG